MNSRKSTISIFQVYPAFRINVEMAISEDVASAREDKVLAATRVTEDGETQILTRDVSGLTNPVKVNKLKIQRLGFNNYSFKFYST